MTPDVPVSDELDGEQGADRVPFMSTSRKGRGKSARSRSRTRLPRLTVLALSKTELTAFVLSVEQLRHVVANLTELAEELRVRVSRRPRKAAAATPANGEEVDRG